MMTKLTVNSGGRTDFVDITSEVRQAVGRLNLQDGVVTVFVPHTTAGVTINEHADPAVMADVELVLDRMVPWTGGYRHSEGNTAAHVKASLVGSSVRVIVQGGELQLGTWQGIFFCEFDGPRTRSVLLEGADRG
jgi:secondary thiamine-phosphate synthase enzyme